MIKAMDLLADQAQQDSSDVDPASPAAPSVWVPSMNNPLQNSPKTAAPTQSEDRSSASPSFSQEATLRRLHGMEEMLIRMEKGIEILISPFERTSMRTNGRSADDFITRDEQNAAMEQLTNRLQAEIDRRFEVQNRSVQSLRTMIARTDELLEKVIESLESTSFTS